LVLENKKKYELLKGIINKLLQAIAIMTPDSSLEMLESKTALLELIEIFGSQRQTPYKSSEIWMPCGRSQREKQSGYYIHLDQRRLLF
jgi:hypothetical protein